MRKGMAGAKKEVFGEKKWQWYWQNNYQTNNHHRRRSSIGRSSGMYLIRLDSAAIWTRHERRREGNSQQGWGNLCFRRKWDLRDSYSHPLLPLLPPLQLPLEPPRPACGRSPNRTIYRPLSRGRECKSYLYSISGSQVNISNSPWLPVFRAKVVLCKSLKSTCWITRVPHSLSLFLALDSLHNPDSFSFKYLNYKYLPMSRNSSFWLNVRLKTNEMIWQAILLSSDGRLLRFIEIHARAWGKWSLNESRFYDVVFSTTNDAV